MVWVGVFLLINAITFGTFALDKWLATLGARRISERTLLTLAFVGGSAGAVLAQQTLRHKTRKEPFRTQLLVVIGLQGVIMIALFAPHP